MNLNGIKARFESGNSVAIDKAMRDTLRRMQAWQVIKQEQKRKMSAAEHGHFIAPEQIRSLKS